MGTPVRDTRQEILVAATTLFHRQGYGATKVQQIAEAVGISKGNLTYHFPSKEALFEAVHELALCYVQERMLQRTFADAPDAITGLEDFTRRLRRWLIDPDGNFLGCLFVNIAVEAQHSDPAVAAHAREALRLLKRLLAAQLEGGQRRGEVRDDQGAASLSSAFFWMYEGALTLSRAMNDPAEFDAFRAHLRPWLSPDPTRRTP